MGVSEGVAPFVVVHLKETDDGWEKHPAAPGDLAQVLFVTPALCSQGFLLRGVQGLLALA